MVAGVDRRRCRTNLAGKIEMRSGLVTHTWNDVRARLIGFNVTPDHVDKVDVAGASKTPRYLGAFAFGNATLPILIAHHAHANNEISANSRAHGSQTSSENRSHVSRLPP